MSNAQTYENSTLVSCTRVADIQTRFNVRLKYDIDTVGKVLPYADFRIRPSLLRVAHQTYWHRSDYKFVKQMRKLQT